MSYAPVPNYYNTTSNNHARQRYVSPGDNLARPNVYQTQMRGVEANQGQYATNQYSWPNQNQNTANMPNTQSTYSSDQWQGRSDVPNSYNHSRSTYAQQEPVNVNNQTYQSRDTYNSQNTQGLNHLAYASGLEPAVPTSNARSAAQSTAGYSVPAASTTIARTNSPAQNNNRQGAAHLSQQNQNAYSASSNNVSSYGNGDEMAGMNAAVALAGAVRGRQAASSGQQNRMSAVRASTSPMITNAQTVNQVAPQYHASTQSSSYNTGPPAAQHARKPSGQPVNSTFTTAPPRPQSKNTVKTAQSSIRKPQASRMKSESGSLPTASTNDEQRATTNSNPQSIANLVTNIEDSEPQVYNSVENQESMPHCIDPTQVFNPYHREHERKKREAAAAEAQKRIEQQRQATEAQKVAEEAAKQVRESSTTANSKSKITKKAPPANSRAQPSISNELPAQSISPSADGNMATEMQKMMSKLKEFRNSDPAMFQKLWNEMRRDGPTLTSASSAPQAATAPPASSDTQPANISPPPPPQVQNNSSVTPALDTSARNAGTPRSRAKKQEDSAYPVPTGYPLNGFKVVVENNPGNLPDLGRFPAERRVRLSYGPNGASKQRHEALPVDTQLDDTSSVTTDLVAESIAHASAQLPSGQVPATRPTDGIAWPEPRRRAVAIAAVDLLRAVPANFTIPIEPQDICNMLERNPSYLDLCTALENRGLKFQRTVFARELLRNVPELQSKSSTPAHKEVATMSAVAQGQLPQPPIHSTSTTSDSMRLTTVNSMQNEIKGEAAPRQAVKASTGPKPRPHPSRQEPPIGSKEAAARKRDFSELIDLTEIDNDENYVLPPRKVQKNDPTIDSLKNPATIPTSATTFGSMTSQPLRFNPQPQNLPQPSVGVMRPPEQRQLGLHNQPPLNAFQQKTNQQSNNIKTSLLLAKKLDKSEALHKTYYDPRTVAKDILIASGRHPSEKPLNLHLANFLGSFIELESDLTTFDWDSIDPGGPPPPQVEYVDVLAAPPRFKLGERVTNMKKTMMDIEKSQDAESRGESRHTRPTLQSPAPNTKHPSTLPDKGRQGGLHRKLVVHRYSREINDPTLRNPSSTESATRKFSIDIPQLSQSPTKSPIASGPKSSPNSKMESEPLTSTTKRRGRPPGSKNKNPSVTAMKRQAQVTVLAPTPPPTSNPANLALSKPDEAPEPIVHSYKCRWIRCHAELHNIDILKRHVFKKHAPDDAQFICWWKHCRFLKREDDQMAVGHIFDDREQWMAHIEKDHIEPIALKYGDGPIATNTGKQSLKKLDLSKFLYHSQKTVTRTLSATDPHNVELARQRYLTDYNGRITTPLVTSDGNTDYPHDIINLIEAYPQGPKTDKQKSEMAAQNAFMRAHGNRHKDGRKAAEEVVRAMEVRKQNIGPGIDRGGCTLINEARRNTFVQAPGISRIVDYQY